MTTLRSRRVEILGTPGAGKSLLHARLVAHLGGGDIVGYDEMARRMARELKPGCGVINRLNASLPWANRSETHRLDRRLGVRADEAVGGLVGIDNFLDFCFGTLAGRDAASHLRVRRAGWLTAGLRKAAIADVVRDRETVVFDELLCQCGFGIGLSGTEPEYLWRSYFTLVPPPRAVIAAKASAATIHTRLGKRDGPESRHLANVGAGLAFLDIATDVLTKRGVVVLGVDSECDPEHNARDLVERLRALE